MIFPAKSLHSMYICTHSPTVLLNILSLFTVVIHECRTLRNYSTLYEYGICMLNMNLYKVCVSMDYHYMLEYTSVCFMSGKTIKSFHSV